MRKPISREGGEVSSGHRFRCTGAPPINQIVGLMYSDGAGAAVLAPRRAESLSHADGNMVDADAAMLTDIGQNSNSSDDGGQRNLQVINEELAHR